MSTQNSDSRGTSAMNTVPKKEVQTVWQEVVRQRHNEDPSYASTTFHRSGYLVAISLLYGTAALFSWVVICILVHKPFGAQQYGASIVNGDGWGTWLGTTAQAQAPYLNSQYYYRIASVVQSVVTTITLPLTSSVCAWAAVHFVQQNQQLTMRGTIALADKAWSDPRVIATLPWCWRHYGSSFLLVSIFLNVLGKYIPRKYFDGDIYSLFQGFAVPLAQNIFLTSKTIKTPTSSQEIMDLTDISDHFRTIETYDTGFTTALTRSRLASTWNTSPQARLWSNDTSQHTLANLSSLISVKSMIS